MLKFFKKSAFSHFTFTKALTLTIIACNGLLPLISAVAQAESVSYLMMTSPVISDKQVSDKQILAQVALDAPPAFVWQQITNYPQLKRILPGYQKSDVIQSGGNQKTLDMMLKVSPFLPVYHFQARMRENRDTMQLNMERISGDFKVLKASYRLQPRNGGRQTLLVYSLTLDTGVPLPGTAAVLKSHTQRCLKALQSYIGDVYAKDMIGKR